MLSKSISFLGREEISIGMTAATGDGSGNNGQAARSASSPALSTKAADRSGTNVGQIKNDGKTVRGQDVGQMHLDKRKAHAEQGVTRYAGVGESSRIDQGNEGDAFDRQRESGRSGRTGVALEAKSSSCGPRLWASSIQRCSISARVVIAP